MAFDFGVIADNAAYLLWGQTGRGEPGGLLLTVLMATAAGVLALVIGVSLALVAWARGGWVRRGIFWWADFIRAIPLLFVIFWLYFLLPALLGGRVPGTLSIVLALAWFSSAAVMHATLAGLEAISRGQSEAAAAQGFRRGQTLLFVLLPQAMGNLVPSYVGVFVSLIKDTSLAYIVNVPELTTLAGRVNNQSQVYPAEVFLFTAVLYLLLCGGLSLAVQWTARSRGRRRNAATATGS